MSKLISLEGAICTFKLDETYACAESFALGDTTNVVLKFTTSAKNYNGSIIGGDSSFGTTDCKLVTDDSLSFVGYGYYGYNKYIHASFILDEGDYLFYDLTSLILDFTNSNISADTLTDQQLIDVLVANCDIEGGIYEEEHKVQIINPQMYIIPPTKAVGNDLVVSAEEVVVNEAKTSFNVVVNLETNPIGSQHYIYYLHINGEFVNSIYAAGSSTTLPTIEGATTKSFNDVTTIAVNLSMVNSDYNSNSVKYKIDDGEQQTSSDPITITKDCTITFYIPWGD